MFTVLILLALLFSRSLSWGFGTGVSDLAGLSIEDLMSVEVTLVSSKAQRLSDTAAAVFVITNEDLRRSGVTPLTGGDFRAPTPP